MTQWPADLEPLEMRAVYHDVKTGELSLGSAEWPDPKSTSPAAHVIQVVSGIPFSQSFALSFLNPTRELLGGKAEEHRILGFFHIIYKRD